MQSTGFRTKIEMKRSKSLYQNHWKINQNFLGILTEIAKLFLLIDGEVSTGGLNLLAKPIGTEISRVIRVLSILDKKGELKKENILFDYNCCFQL